MPNFMRKSKSYAINSEKVPMSTSGSDFRLNELINFPSIKSRINSINSLVLNGRNSSTSKLPDLVKMTRTSQSIEQRQLSKALDHDLENRAPFDSLASSSVQVVQPKEKEFSFLKRNFTGKSNSFRLVSLLFPSHTTKKFTLGP